MCISGFSRQDVAPLFLGGCFVKRDFAYDSERRFRNSSIICFILSGLFIFLFIGILMHSLAEYNISYSSPLFLHLIADSVIPIPLSILFCLLGAYFKKNQSRARELIYRNDGSTTEQRVMEYAIYADRKIE